MATLNAPGADAAATGMAQEALDAFTNGLNGRQPDPAVIEIAAQIANAALTHTTQPEITLDLDGALSFDLRTPSGNLILAELTPNGALDASIFDRQNNPLQRLPSATPADLTAWFRG